MVQHNCIDTLSGASLSPTVTMSPTWRGWFQDGKRLLVAETLRLFAQAQAWDRRARARRRLAALDARLLDDIGLSPDDVKREAAKAFWQD